MRYDEAPRQGDAGGGDVGREPVDPELTATFRRTVSAIGTRAVTPAEVRILRALTGEGSPT